MGISAGRSESRPFLYRFLDICFSAIADAAGCRLDAIVPGRNCRPRLMGNRHDDDSADVHAETMRAAFSRIPPTEQTLSKIGTADDVANVVMFLAARLRR
jgi:hypothetical protein